MRVTRRSVLGGLGALPFAHAPAWASVPVLAAQEAYAQIAPEGYDTTPVWAYDGLVPGPEIRVRQGGRVSRLLRNTLPDDTAVHWHGIRVENAMDGVPGLTQNAIAPGEEFLYDFAVPDAGTYWYHSHNRSMEQVARGLAGPLIIEEASDAPDVEHDVVLMIDDWRLDPETVEIAPFGNFHDLSHAGRIGNIVTTNGQYDWSMKVRRHDRLRLRVVNAANARVFRLRLKGLEGVIVALDGMPVANPVPASVDMDLAPAQRIDLIVDVVAEAGEVADLVSLERDGGFSIAGFEVTAGGRRARREAARPLPPNPVPDAGDPAQAPLMTLRMEGGAMRGLGPTRHKGEVKDGRAVMQEGQFWSFNGQAGLDEMPFFELSRGEVRRISMINDTAFPHGIHLHGHHFHVMNGDGSLGVLRDTVLVAPGETRQILMVADNPGDWLLHCHMLGHAMSGMNTWFRVL